MISAPSGHARAIAALLPNLKPGARALDIGAGSGYMSAVFALACAGRGCHVIAQERTRGLAEHAVAVARNHLLQQGHAEAAACLVAASGDGRMGHAAGAPYDVIYVGGSMPAVPSELLQQLAPEGRMLLCVGPRDETQQQTLIVPAAPAGGGRREVVIAHTMMHVLLDID
mmetsp:Transcript_59996/g.164444  ORF Transcript_59996/g.164444 Transcript_59996/m.164444 type:complete len:170 (-) Transcript_59996:107-616(-)